MALTRRPHTPIHQKPLLSVEETAILLGRSRSAVYRAIDRGDLPLPVYRMAVAIRSRDGRLSGCSMPRSSRQHQACRTARPTVVRGFATEMKP